MVGTGRRVQTYARLAQHLFATLGRGARADSVLREANLHHGFSNARASSSLSGSRLLNRRGAVSPQSSPPPGSQR
eukprot:11171703-Lingulodinium_polyedra.AAC.1